MNYSKNMNHSLLLQIGIIERKNFKSVEILIKKRNHFNIFANMIFL